MYEVLETAKKVAEKSPHVRIDQHALTAFSRKLIEDGIQIPVWENFYHFHDGSEKTVAYLLVLDSLNFCFWPGSGNRKWEIQYQQNNLSGYYALAASLKKAVETGMPITEPAYLAEISLDGLKRMLGGRGELQLLDQRRRILNELGRVLLEDYQSQAHHMVEAADGSAVKLAILLADKLPSFRDKAEYMGERVLFLKRAQIFAADLYATFKGNGWGCFRDMDKLTAFADYKIPQVLRQMGIFQYSQALAQQVDREILLEAGSPEEVEIRANTIWTIELIRQELVQLGVKFRSFEIDWILWNLGQQDAFREKPYHKTVTIFY